MKKLTITSVFGIIGALSWTLTILLREITTNNIDIVNFILGIMPNISATWAFIWAGESILKKLNKDFTLKASVITSGLIFLFSIISEIIHHVFLNSPFDIYDIVATILAIVLYLIIFYINRNSENINE